MSYTGRPGQKLHPEGTGQQETHRLTVQLRYQIAKWAAANPGTAVCAGVGLAFVAAPMAVAAPVLGAIGFGSSGIVAGI